MTLAPDYQAFTVPREIVDAPPLVSVVPDRGWANLTLPPEDAPEKDNLPLARDIVLAHLNDGHEAGDDWKLVWFAIGIDLNNPDVFTYDEARDLVADYAHFARLNGGTDWDPQDAEDIRNQIDRHLRAAGYTEGN